MYKRLKAIIENLESLILFLDMEGFGYESRLVEVEVNELMQIADKLKRNKRGKH